jgi:hypothetical protein
MSQRSEFKDSKDASAQPMGRGKEKNVMGRGRPVGYIIWATLRMDVSNL